MRSVIRSIQLNSPVSEVWNCLLHPSAVKSWWSANQAIIHPEKGGIYAVSWGENIDDPDYVTYANIVEFERFKKLSLANYSYFAKTGNLPFEAEFTNDFILEESPAGTILKVVQDGFPDDAIADDYLKGCEKGWEDVLSAIKNFLES